MPYSFNPFSGNFDNTPSTLKGDSAYHNLSSYYPLTGGSLYGSISASGSGSFESLSINEQLIAASVLFVGNGKVGILTETPNEALTVVGNISATGDILNQGIDNILTNIQSISTNYATINFTNEKFFPLSGGLITSDTRINGNVTIFGDLSSTGTQTFANTIFTTTSSLSIVHIGSGPALWVGNNGSGDIASFNDIDQGIEVLHIGGANGDFPNVGVKTSAPNKDFTVNGEISASNTIWDANGNSNNWNSSYSTVQSNSATNWNYQGTDLKGLSASWQNTYTNYSTNSAFYATQNYIGSNFLPLSGDTITGELTAKELHVEDKFTVSTGSATLFIESGRIGINTEVPTQALTVFGNISATGTLFVSGGNSNNWNSSYNTVQSNSATNWNYQGTDLKGLTANYDSAYSTVQSNSATNWNYQGTDLKGLSASWQNTYTDYSANSAFYATSSFVQSNFLPLSGGSITGVFEAGVGSTTLFVSSGIVGINTETPNEALTVVGNISASGLIYGNELGLISLLVYETNALAVGGGLAVGTVYRTSTGELRIVI